MSRLSSGVAISSLGLILLLQRVFVVQVAADCFCRHPPAPHDRSHNKFQAPPHAAPPAPAPGTPQPAPPRYPIISYASPQHTLVHPQCTQWVPLRTITGSSIFAAAPSSGGLDVFSLPPPSLPFALRRQHVAKRNPPSCFVNLMLCNQHEQVLRGGGSIWTISTCSTARSSPSSSHHTSREQSRAAPGQ
jgi:hypothetical protein